jgi:hypothetical protein
MICIFFLVVVTISIFQCRSTSLRDDFCSRGRWKQIANNGSLEINIFAMKRAFDEYTSNDDIIKEICPMEIFQQNCFYHGIKNRTSLIMKRTWESDDRECHHFTPHKFLSEVRGRNLHFIGDSTMTQLYNSFVCTLFTSIKTFKVDYNAWEQYHGSDGTNKDGFSNKTCPLGKQNCFHSSAKVSFPSFKASLDFRTINNFGDSASSVLNLFTNYPDDIFIYNFGLHYNEQSQYQAHISKFVANFTQLTNPPQIYFLETTPQHFNNSLNGYYHNKKSIGPRCVPSQNFSLSNLHDWRNRILEQTVQSRENQVCQ